MHTDAPPSHRRYGSRATRGFAILRVVIRVSQCIAALAFLSAPASSSASCDDIARALIGVEIDGPPAFAPQLHAHTVFDNPRCASNAA